MLVVFATVTDMFPVGAGHQLMRFSLKLHTSAALAAWDHGKCGRLGPW